MAVVITGYELVSPLGYSRSECTTNMLSNKTAIREIESFDTALLPMKAAGEVKRDGKVVLTPSNIDRKALFLEDTLSQLMESSKIEIDYSPEELRMNIGIGVDYIDIANYFRKREYLKPAGSETSFYKSAESIKSLVRKKGVLGGCNLFTASCVASAQAIGLSYRLIKRGGYRGAIITGGSDSMISHVSYTGFYMLRAMSLDNNPTTACRPFDRRRSGTVLGEGAALMLLEDSSKTKKKDILAEIVGYGCSMDAYALTDPDPSGKQLAKAIASALKDAGLQPSEIDAIHLHGTGTIKNALAEYQALLQIFGSRASEIPVYSMKGQIGHLIGSCTAVEILAVLHSIEKQEILPTVNFEITDPNAPLYVVKNKPLPLSIKYLLKVNASFGGHNTALIFKKPS